MVSQTLLLELKQILKESGYSDQTDSEISELGNGLFNYFDHLVRLACENKYENENKRNKIS